LGSRRHQPNDVSSFSKIALPTVREPIYIITTDGDCKVPSDLEPHVVQRMLDSPLVIKWYTQNYDGSLVHPKLRPIPIGLDLHTGLSPFEKLRRLHSVLQNAIPWKRRENKILMDITSLWNEERLIAANLLSTSSQIATMVERVPFVQAMQRYSHYRYAVSLAGNGLDCHRTWELLFLNTVPVVKTNSLDPLYSGLPVIILKDWREAADPDNLSRWKTRCEPLLSDDSTKRLLRRHFAPDLFSMPEVRS